MSVVLSQRWDLEALFPGGSGSAEFAAFLDALDQEIAAVEPQVAGVEAALGSGQMEAWRPLVTLTQNLLKRLRQAGSFSQCLVSQDVQDQRARSLVGRVRQLYAAYAVALRRVDRQLLRVPEPAWQALLGHPTLQPVAFSLAERRRRADEKLPPEQEALVDMLVVDGYHGWSELYNTVVGRLSIPFEENGRTVLLSAGQAENRLRDPDRGLRAAAFARWEDAWAGVAELCASALNHLAGFRLNLYRQRGWDSALREPLDLNRMSPATLEAMWAAVDQGQDRLVAYLERNALLAGVDRLDWHDLAARAPGTRGGQITYADAAAFITEQFERLSPRLAGLAHHAFSGGWIEAENRPGKRPGGFCTSFPLAQQSRIFLTFAGHMSNAATIAHELGHAFHQHVLEDLPPLAQTYAMNVAETASTFAELSVLDAALRYAADPQQRLALLTDRLEAAVAYFMNLRARFEFEVSFYNARRQGPVGVEQLNELMESAERQAYRGALASYHPLFWAAKQHFYLTDVPFYNFPYTFGYLFSAGVYARAREAGPGFEQAYVDLLRDTGRMTVEDLAARHLGVDLTRPDFWHEAVQFTLHPLDEFLALTQVR